MKDDDFDFLGKEKFYEEQSRAMDMSRALFGKVDDKVWDCHGWDRHIFGEEVGGAVFDAYVRGLREGTKK